MIHVRSESIYTKALSLISSAQMHEYYGFNMSANPFDAIVT